MSSSYSVLERNLAFFIRKFPKLKSKLKYVYQYFNFILYKKKYNVKSKFDIIENSYLDYETFFGYYDKSPLNEDGSKILYHASKYTTTKLPDLQKPILIVLKDIYTDKVLYTDEVSTYNWQQGAKIQWLTNNSFIYNSYQENKYISKKVIIEKDEIKVDIIDFPIYDCYVDQGYSLNFDKLNVMRPDYGYQNGDKRFTEEYTKDGIFHIDLNTGEFNLMISLKEIIEFKPLDTMEGAKHKCNHIMMSPDGNSFMFLHRWFQNGVKHDRLLKVNTIDSSLSILLDDDMISHCYWINNNEIITFANTYKKGTGYYILNIKNKSVEKLDNLPEFNLGDGHPVVLNETEVLFDTYPNRSRIKKLFKYNLKTKEIEEIAEFFESFKFYGETRCDLHPRWGRNNKTIYVDSVHDDNKRKLYKISLN